MLWSIKEYGKFFAPQTIKSWQRRQDKTIENLTNKISDAGGSDSSLPSLLRRRQKSEPAGLVQGQPWQKKGHETPSQPVAGHSGTHLSSQLSREAQTGLK
jgi:hypothetical protein